MATVVSKLLRRCLAVSMTTLLIETRWLSISWRWLDYWIVYDEVLLVDIIVYVIGGRSSLLVRAALCVFTLFISTDGNRMLIARLTTLGWNGLSRC